MFLRPHISLLTDLKRKRSVSFLMVVLIPAISKARLLLPKGPLLLKVRSFLTSNWLPFSLQQPWDKINLKILKYKLTFLTINYKHILENDLNLIQCKNSHFINLLSKRRKLSVNLTFLTFNFKHISYIDI